MWWRDPSVRQAACQPAGFRVFESMKKVTTTMISATHMQAMHSGRAGRGFGTLVRQLLFAAFAALCLPSFASAQTANLWVDSSGGSCTRQSTAGAYSDAAACAGMQAALSACVAGDTIRMKAGTYGAQTITAIKTSPGCTVIAETGTTIGALTTNGAWYEIQNVSGTGWDISAAGTNNITCRGCNFTGNNGVNWAANGWSNVSWIGGSLRNFSCSSCANGMAIFASTNVAGSSTATGVLVDGVTFDKIVNTGGTANHFEVIRVDGNVNGLTIRNSTFTNNITSTSLVFFSTFRGNKPQNITLENNFFGGLGPAYYTLNMNYQGSVCSNWTMRYNTFQNAMIAGGNCPYTNIVWVGNLGPRGNCEGTAFRSNVWFGSSGGSCGASDTVVTSAGLGSDGFRLTAGSAAIDKGGSGTDCIATDHDGNSRPAGGRCDAGAHESGAASALPPPQSLFVQ